MFKYITLILTAITLIVSFSAIEDVRKVAPRDPHDRCKTHPESQPYCKKKVKKKSGSTAYYAENIDLKRCKGNCNCKLCPPPPPPPIKVA